YPHSHALEATALPPSSVAELVPSRGPLRVYFVDVGHGDATLMECPDGRVLLVDAGKEETARSLLVPYLTKALPGRRIDYFILTHQHFDHSGGFFDVLDNFEVGEVWTNGLTLLASQETSLQVKRIPVKV